MCVCMDNSAYGKYWNCTRYPNSHDSFLDNFPIAQKYKSDLLIILLTNYDTSWKLQLYLPSFHVSKLVYVLKVTPPPFLLFLHKSAWSQRLPCPMYLYVSNLTIWSLKGFLLMINQRQTLHLKKILFSLSDDGLSPSMAPRVCGIFAIPYVPRYTQKYIHIHTLHFLTLWETNTKSF